MKRNGNRKRTSTAVRWHIVGDGVVYDTVYSSYKAALKRMCSLEGGEWYCDGVQVPPPDLEIIEEQLSDGGF